MCLTSTGMISNDKNRESKIVQRKDRYRGQIYDVTKKKKKKSKLQVELQVINIAKS